MQGNRLLAQQLTAGGDRLPQLAIEAFTQAEHATAQPAQLGRRVVTDAPTGVEGPLDPPLPRRQIGQRPSPLCQRARSHPPSGRRGRPYCRGEHQQADAAQLEAVAVELLGQLGQRLLEARHESAVDEQLGRLAVAPTALLEPHGIGERAERQQPRAAQIGGCLAGEHRQQLGQIQRLAGGFRGDRRGLDRHRREASSLRQGTGVPNVERAEPAAPPVVGVAGELVLGQPGAPILGQLAQHLFARLHLLALALHRGLLEMLTLLELGQDTRLLALPLEPPEGVLEALVFTYVH